MTINLGDLGDTAAEQPEFSLEIIEKYCTDAPRAQNAIDVFADDWSSVLPDAVGVDSGGFAGLFDDPRIDWMVEVLGPVVGHRILELGPLEGGHTYSLETKFEASEIVAVEANQRAYLKCLITKELLHTTRSRFLLGDFNHYMAELDEPFDLVVACGVLYHMEDPGRHIELLCRSADSVFVWTHFYDRDLIEALGPNVSRKFTTRTTAEHDGYRYTLHRQDYLDALGWGGFCGAGKQFANWIELEDMYNLFDRNGFAITATGFEHLDHPHGPALAFIAQRREAPGPGDS